jgi:hypothetical protein
VKQFGDRNNRETLVAINKFAFRNGPKR